MELETAVEFDRKFRAKLLEWDSWSPLFEEIKQLAEELKEGEIHRVLGYGSFFEYLTDAVTVMGKLSRAARRQVVGLLAAEGVNNYTIASVVNVSPSTVRTDRIAVEQGQVAQLTSNPPPALPSTVVGRDGRSYPARRGPMPDRLPPAPLPPPLTADDRATVLAGRINERARGLCRALRDLIALPGVTPEVVSMVFTEVYPEIDNVHEAIFELCDWADADLASVEGLA